MCTHSTGDEIQKLMKGDKVCFPHLNVPDLYFEQTTDTFKCSPLTVKRSGGLSCNWTSTSLTRVEQGFMGFYLAWDLHRRPHYMLSRSKRKEAINISNGKNVPFHGIPATKSHFNFGDICVVNYGTLEWTQLIDDSMIKQLNLDSLCNFMLNKIAVDTLKMEHQGKTKMVVIEEMFLMLLVFHI